MAPVANVSDVTKADSQGCGSGALLDDFGVLIQALLALVAFSTLMLKRFREPASIRRPWRIWFYDTSKQAIGALFIHFANVFLSTLTIEDPCSLYLMNFLLDATLGMLVIWVAVKAVQKVLLDYIPNPQLELALVMLIVPFFVNAIMFWVVDSLMMRKYNKSLATIKGSCDTGKQGESSPLSSEESQVLLAADPDVDLEASEGEQDKLKPGSPHTLPGGSKIPGWVFAMSDRVP
ncbi:transmembrane protein 110-like [Scleropages formosus]|uniref:Transmembrane protein 110-like n=1 Tax=Scleropages formosus TaxID=113540 RepID=A0A0P7YYJ4_SCLFO|nr:transmembrane protein 110-like [Scleropages formosus]